MKRIVVLIVFLFIEVSAFAQQPDRRLKVTNDGHYLQYADGTPFFWLGDTGWDIFVKLNLDQIKKYLDNRAAKGFNVIQAVALAEHGFLSPNAYNQTALKDADTEQPNEQYFKLIDSTIEMAADRHMFIALLPTWGDKVTKMWGEGPEIFDSLNAYKFGNWIGNRYKNNWNIVWVIGGDRPAFSDKSDWRAIWRAMARGIRKGTDGKALITYHPSGEKSSAQFWSNQDDVLDFNILQSGHGALDVPVWKMIGEDYNIKPAKPALDSEPNYEDIPITWNPKKGYFRAYDVRKQIYRSVFSGACGVTYGNNPMFFFYRPGDKNIGDAERYWDEALDRPGAFQAGYLKKLILSRQPLNRIPDQSLILSGQGKDNANYITAFRGTDNSYVMVYMPVGKEIQVNTKSIKSKRIRISWFDPRTGKTDKSFIIKKSEAQSFIPPTQGIGMDWVLILDDAKKGYKIL